MSAAVSSREGVCTRVQGICGAVQGDDEGAELEAAAAGCVWRAGIPYASSGFRAIQEMVSCKQGALPAHSPTFISYFRAWIFRQHDHLYMHGIIFCTL